jgi:cell division cycle 2-like
MWSVGCIFAELLLKEPLFQAKTEIELLSMIFKLLGPPTQASWPEYNTLPMAKTITLPLPQPHQLPTKFQYLSAAGIDLMSSLLSYNPESRITAEQALQHAYFRSVTWLSLIHQKIDIKSPANLLSQSIPISLDRFHP